MDFSIDKWMKEYCAVMEERFGQRIWFMGLQGSYARGEATPQSDIDAVLILDELNVGDMALYAQALDMLDERERICGFFGGRRELFAWEPAELFQFCRDTAAYRGSIDSLLAKVCEEDIVHAVRTGACAVYHACIHDLLHERSLDILKEAYKSAFFTLQAKAFLKTGRYARSGGALISLLDDKDAAVIRQRLELRRLDEVSYDELCALAEPLISWAKETICAFDMK